ncbi:MAG: glutathione S-transferase [Verrucomicrobiota bacterium]
MKIKFYQFPHSPYCIPIALILKQSGLEYEEILVPNWDRSIVAELTQGAYYEVPVIEHDDRVIYEHSDTSLDIARYTNGLLSSELFPKSISGIHEILIEYIESKLEGIGFKTVDPEYTRGIQNIAHQTALVRHKKRRFGKGCLEQWADQQEDLLKEFYQRIDQFKGCLTENTFLFGKVPVFADYALYGVLGNVHYFPKNIQWEKRGWLKAWQDRLLNHPI